MLRDSTHPESSEVVLDNHSGKLPSETGQPSQARGLSPYCLLLKRETSHVNAKLELDSTLEFRGCQRKEMQRSAGR